MRPYVLIDGSLLGDPCMPLSAQVFAAIFKAGPCHAGMEVHVERDHGTLRQFGKFHLLNPLYLTFNRAERPGFHRQPDTVKHEPCCRLADAKGAVKLQATDAVLAISNGPDGDEPLIETERAIFKDRPYLDGKLLAAVLSLALEHRPGRDNADLLPTALGAGDFAVGPFHREHGLKADLGRREVADGFQQGLGCVVHVSQSSSGTWTQCTVILPIGYSSPGLASRAHRDSESRHGGNEPSVCRFEKSGKKRDHLVSSSTAVIGSLSESVLAMNRLAILIHPEIAAKSSATGETASTDRPDAAQICCICVRLGIGELSYRGKLQLTPGLGWQWRVGSKDKAAPGVLDQLPFTSEAARLQGTVEAHPQRAIAAFVSVTKQGGSRHRAGLSRLIAARHALILQPSSDESSVLPKI